MVITAARVVITAARVSGVRLVRRLLLMFTLL